MRNATDTATLRARHQGRAIRAARLARALARDDARDAAEALAPFNRRARSRGHCSEA